MNIFKPLLLHITVMYVLHAIKVINRLKLDCYIYKMFQVSLRLTAKQEPIIDKGIKAYHYGKIINFKGRHQEMKKIKYKTARKLYSGTKLLTMNNYFKCKWLKVKGPLYSNVHCRVI